MKNKVMSKYSFVNICGKNVQREKKWRLLYLKKVNGYGSSKTILIPRFPKYGVIWHL